MTLNEVKWGVVLSSICIPVYGEVSSSVVCETLATAKPRDSFEIDTVAASL
jgi:hypothetical protein